MDPYEPEHTYRCKHCGQALCVGSDLAVSVTLGWRYDEAAEVWRPTTYAQERFDRAQRQLSDPARTAEEKRQLRERLRIGVAAFARPDHGKSRIGSTVPFDHTMRPVALQCPQCGGITPFD